MTRSAYVLTTLLALLAAVLAGVTIWLSHANGSLRTRLQVGQEALGRGVLGAQGQQISSSILQAMANAAVSDRAMRALLEKHGYRVQATEPSAGGVAAVPPGEVAP
jgi:hypothetical protein